MIDTKVINEANSNQLNFIRIAAALMVMFGHGFGFFKLTILQDDSVFPYIQNVGVVIFFMLSGFLSFYSLESYQNRRLFSFKDYLINRGARIIPAYIGAICFVAILDGIFIRINPQNYQYYSSYNIRTAIFNVLFLQNLPFKRICTCFGTGRPFWTLAIEWWIYIFFGYNFIYLLGKIKENKQITFGNFVIWVVLSIIPFYWLISEQGDGLTLVWALGGMCYHLYKRVKISKNFSLVGMFSSILWCFFIGYYFKDAYHLLFYLGVFSFLFFFLETKRNCISKKSPILSAISAYTYCLYLVHYSVFEFLCYNWSDGDSGIVKLILGVVISILVAWLIHVTIETKRRKIEKFCYTVLERLKMS